MGFTKHLQFAVELIMNLAALYMQGDCWTTRCLSNSCKVPSLQNHALSHPT
jgi:hypothetical protein